MGHFSSYQIVAATNMSMVAMLCHLLFAFLDFLGKNGGYGNPGKWVGLFVIYSVHVLYAFLDFLGKNGGYGNPGKSIELFGIPKWVCLFAIS